MVVHLLARPQGVAVSRDPEPLDAGTIAAGAVQETAAAPVGRSAVRTGAARSRVHATPGPAQARLLQGGGVRTASLLARTAAGRAISSLCATNERGNQDSIKFRTENSISRTLPSDGMGLSVRRREVQLCSNAHKFLPVSRSDGGPRRSRSLRRDREPLEVSQS